MSTRLQGCSPPGNLCHLKECQMASRLRKSLSIEYGKCEMTISIFKSLEITIQLQISPPILHLLKIRIKGLTARPKTLMLYASSSPNFLYIILTLTTSLEIAVNGRNDRTPSKMFAPPKSLDMNKTT